MHIFIMSKYVHKGESIKKCLYAPKHIASQKWVRSDARLGTTEDRGRGQMLRCFGHGAVEKCCCTGTGPMLGVVPATRC